MCDLMIIDIHTHIVAEEWLPELWWRSQADFLLQTAAPFGFHSYEDIRDKRFSKLWDPEAEKLIAAMDEAGICQSVILPLDFGVALGEAAVSIEEQNRKIAELQARNPERLIAFVGVDPRRTNAVEIMERGIKDYGMKGVKLYPASGFYPNEAILHRFFERSVEWNVPVLVHTGHASQPLQSKYCKPIHLDDVLVRFPNVKLVAAHLGGGWHDELFWMGATKSNLFVDISAWQPVCVQDFPFFCRHLRRAIDMFGLYRVLFGSDAPFYNSVCSQKKFVERIATLTDHAPADVTFRRAEIQAVLGENGKRLLGLAEWSESQGRFGGQQSG